MRTNYAGTEDDTVELGINYKVTFNAVKPYKEAN